jgi:tetratricopeptide (TPR) repeat protein
MFIRARIGVLIFLVVLAVFAPALNNGFVGFDDRLYVTQNPHVRAGITTAGVAWAFQTTHTGNWHPLTWLSHMTDSELFGLDPGMHHLTSAILHALSALVLFLVLSGATASLWRSAVVALLFALHPLHVESVAWAAERKDVLSALFWMLTLWTYLSYARKPRVSSYVLALGLFGLGLLAKPMLVTLPFVLLLFDLWPLRRLRLTGGTEAEGPQPGGTVLFAAGRLPGLILEKIPFLALSVLASAVTLAVQRGAGNVSTLEAISVTSRLSNAVVAYVVYIKRMIWPRDLAFFYPYAKSIPAWIVVGAAILLVAVTVLVLREVRRRPYLATGWLWYLGTLLPVIGLVQVGMQASADRYTYLPLIGLFLIIVWGVAEIADARGLSTALVGAVAALVLVACAANTLVQISYWRDSVTLYERALNVTTDNYVVMDLMGSALARQGRVREAIPYHQRALRIAPRFARAHSNLANALFLEGDLAAAVQHYEQALRARPDYGEAHYNMGIALFQLDRYDEAAERFAEAVRLNPEHRDAQFNLAVVLDRQGRSKQALQHYAAATRLDPHDARLHFALGSALFAQQRYREAITALSRALELEPDFAAARAKREAAIAALQQ